MRESPSLTPQPSPLRDRALLGIAATALRDGRNEVLLNESDIERLETLSDWNSYAPDSLELYVSIAAKSQEAINGGDYLMVVGPRTGDAPAGRSFGRFCDILGQEVTGALRNLARNEETQHPDKIFAELAYLPTHGHAANVTIRPAIRDYEIVVGASSSVSCDKTVSIDDLVIGMRNDRYYIRSLSLGKEIVVRSTHLLNHFSSPNVCRFLSDVCAEGMLPLQSFDWGAATELPFLPRLRYGRIVIHPAEWHVPTDTIPGDNASVQDWWHEWMQAWRQKWNVPRYVYLVESDNRLLLDLDNPICVAELGDECRKRAKNQSTVSLQEMIPDWDNIWTQGSDGEYQSEFIIPLARSQCREQRNSTLPKTRHLIRFPERLRLPGSDWLYTKIYSGKTQHDDLLAGPIRDFTSKALQQGLAENWFFIRYADTEPHIRLRFRGELTTLLGQLLPALVAWGEPLVEARNIHKVVIDSYDREIERYGGLKGLEIAERIFASDSVTIADTLALKIPRDATLSLERLALLTVDNLLSSLGLAADERLNLYRTIRMSQERTFGGQMERLQRDFHSYRKTAQRLIGDRDWLRDQVRGSEVDAYLQVGSLALKPLGQQLRSLISCGEFSTSQSSFFASCAHMHCNRLLGIDRPLEFQVIYLLERTLESLERYAPEGVQIT